ncbi:universal stress protein [Legionella clemsonensis]|uniref:universal stress protein n=1 Tax=Legionella clemsonensis TaxID=1867846 RepID=UPI000B8D14C6|nr:universal stress protein [Legionella clemsonensis]
MQQFSNILFVTHAIKDEAEVLGQTIKLAHDNKAKLSILVICPSFPDSLNDYRASYEEALIDKMQQSIKNAKSLYKLDKNLLSIPIEIHCCSMPDIHIIRHVIRHNNDLLIKEVETTAKGFKALDMELLSKCPCTLFLYRPFKHKQKNIHVGVAIDPETESEAAEDLGLRLLNTANALTKHYQGSLSIISCWNFALESYLRDSVWLKMPQEELDRILQEEEQAHLSLLQSLIQKSQVSNDYSIAHLKGEPEELIPSAVTTKKIDILVMGTVARTGIAGFIIGNTAENILQKLDCSLLALKPHGFISPVKI